ncbi:response regulator transcription factor [Microbacterium album]|uniref:Sensory transduction protein n=1 Tax=Microbacterium album TaxID=2053191 RepID=A0A917MN29_9MICO|nr:response regulator transcription factor [Microbacterium album]GGH50378.1 putative sensory transduction protein [Microbacterium album]
MRERRVAVVVEDDPDVRLLIVQVLEQLGFVVHTAANGLDGVDLVSLHDPVVTTLDIGMPGIDGFEAARRIRRRSATYLVMVSARATGEDQLAGYHAGADDFVAKPFSPRVLRERIESLVRRPCALAPGTTAGEREVTDELAHGPLRLRPEARRAWAAEEELRLSRGELDLLEVLMRAGSRPISAHRLALAVRGRTEGDLPEAAVRAAEIRIEQLAGALGHRADGTPRIEHVAGGGYRLAEADDPRAAFDGATRPGASQLARSAGSA